MVEIVSTVPHESAVKEIVCVSGCGATLRYVPNEVKKYSGTDYSGGSDGREWIDCPNCGEQVTIRSW